MKNSNYYLKKITNNTGGNESKMKNELYLLKQIASNVGADVTGKLKNRNVYLRQIEENTRDFQHLDDYLIMLLFDKKIIQIGDSLELKVLSVVDGKLEAGHRVDFYIEGQDNE